MKQILYCPLIALTFTASIAPLTESATLLTHKETGKRVLLIADVHQINKEIEGISKSEKTKTLAQTTLALFHTVKSKQQKELTDFAHAMLANDDKQDGKTLVVSEIGNYNFQNLFKQAPEELETMQVLPHIIANHLGKSATQEELDIQQCISPLDNGNKNCFQVTDKVHFITGDLFRSGTHLNSTRLNMLLHRIYHDIKDHESLSFFKETCPYYSEGITLSMLKQDLRETLPMLEECGIQKINNEQLLAEVNTLPESTLIIDAAIQLQQNNPRKAIELSNAICTYQANKCDCELVGYAQAFEKSRSIKQMIMNAGADHTDFVKARLVKNGFHVAAESDTAHCLDYGESAISSEQFFTITASGLNKLQQTSPHALLPKIFQA